ncbi:MAG: IS4 family transposase [Bacteroidota bacterium]
MAYSDLRLSRRHDALLDRMVSKQSNVVHQIAVNYAEERGFYRFLQNKQVSIPQMLAQLIRTPAVDLSDRQLVVIGDTTEISLKKARLSAREAAGLGVLSDNRTPGFFAHTNLALDADTGDGIGLSDLMFWTRPVSDQSSKEKSRAKHSRPWREKESHRWWRGIEQSEQLLSTAKQRLYVFDSEADVADLWEEAISQEVDLLIRVQQQARWVPSASMDVFAYLQGFEWRDEYELAISALTRRNYSKNRPQSRRARNAQMQLRFGSVEVQLVKKRPKTVPLYAIEALESAQSCPENEEPIHWVLLTTRPVESITQAREMIKWYEWRWQIEQLFRTLKKQGFQIEETELRTVEAIFKQSLLSFEAAFRVMRLVMARDQHEGQKISEIFSQAEQRCLQKLNQTLEGKTLKQQNPFSPNQLAFASWVIARLGGWKGYQAQRPPGPIRMKRGLEQFRTYCKAWEYFDP